MVSGKAIGTLVVFILSIICVIYPFSFPILLPYLGRKRIPINLTTAPIIAILVLWAAQCIGPGEVSSSSSLLRVTKSISEIYSRLEMESCMSFLDFWSISLPTCISCSGTDGVKPYNILILFFSLAYMAITLDITGVLQAAAFWVSNKGGSNGWKLFLYFYMMLTVLSVCLEIGRAHV